MQHFITARQQHLIEPNHAKSLQANTILVTGIPHRYLNRRSLLNLFDELPGGVKRIWINRNLKELPDLYDRRLAACSKLESAETTLLRIAAKLRLQEAKKKAKASKGKDVDAKKDADPEAPPVDVETAALLVPRDQRPTHRLGTLPFTGKKVDTIEWAREEIKVCNQLLEEGCAAIREEDEAPGAEVQGTGQTTSDGVSRKKSMSPLDSLNLDLFSKNDHIGFKPVDAVKETAEVLKETTTAIKGRISGYGDSKYPPLNSAFVTFNKQIAAHLAVRVLTHHDPYRMSMYIPSLGIASV